MDDGQAWGGCWEAHGVHSEHGKRVPVRVGVIEFDGRDTLALGVANERPVALTDREADEVVELLGWAKQERAMLADLRAQRHTAELKDSLNRAILTEGQWHKIRHALEHDTTSDHEVTVALHALRAAAPSAWTDRSSD